jgi:hypothetical protein
VIRKQRYQENVKAKVANLSSEWADQSWDDINAANMRLSKKLLQEKRTRRNIGTPIGLPMIRVEFEERDGAMGDSRNKSNITFGGLSPMEIDADMAQPSASSSSGAVFEAPPIASAIGQARQQPKRGTFVVYTFGTVKLGKVRRYRGSANAQAMCALTDTRGGPPVPVPLQMLSAP